MISIYIILILNFLFFLFAIFVMQRQLIYIIHHFYCILCQKKLKATLNIKISHGPRSCQDPTCLIYNSYMHITRCGQLHSAKILMIIANQVKAIILQTTTKSNYSVGGNDYYWHRASFSLLLLSCNLSSIMINVKYPIFVLYVRQSHTSRLRRSYVVYEIDWIISEFQ